VIMTLWPTHTSIHDITTKHQKSTWANKITRDSTTASQTHFQRLSICNLFSQNTSPSHDNLRRVSKSPLFHLFTYCRSDTLDWCVRSATSADSSRLIHSILAHSSTLHYCSIFCHHRTSPACSSTTDTLHNALGLAGFKDALLESLVQEINNVWTLMGLWSHTDMLETTLKGINWSLAVHRIQLAAAVSYLVLVGQFFDHGGSFDDAIPILT
jgi:hypothetical protein